MAERHEHTFKRPCPTLWTGAFSMTYVKNTALIHKPTEQ